MMRRLLLLGLLGGLVVPLQGQTPTVNPSYVIFTPSASHNQTLPDGSSYVTSYTLYVYKVGSTSSVKSVSLGKPAPGADGKIRVKVLTTLAALSKDTPHVAKVYASGAVGSKESAESNQFIMVAPAPATDVVIQ